MKTIYFIVSVIVVILFFMFLGNRENPGAQPDHNRPEITNYVPDVIRDSSSNNGPQYNEKTNQADKEKLETRSDVPENQVVTNHTKIDTLNSIRESLSGSFERPKNTGDTDLSLTSGQDGTLNQNQKNAVLLEIRQLLTNNQ